MQRIRDTAEGWSMTGLREGEMWVEGGEERMHRRRVPSHKSQIKATDLSNT